MARTQYLTLKLTYKQANTLELLLRAMLSSGYEGPNGTRSTRAIEGVHTKLEKALQP